MRTRSREIALQVLFQVEFKKAEGLAAPSEKSQSTAIEPASPESIFELYDERDAESLPYARFLAEGVLREKDNLDGKIEQMSHHWKLTRMDLVDRNILRLACFELSNCPDVSHATVIDEAVKLGKKFGQKDSSAFINGVLDQIAKTKVS